jgi:hypothetical protein
MKDDWEMKKLNEGAGIQEKFYNCSAAIALNRDRVMITGGGSPPSSSARIFTLSTQELHKDSKMLSPRNAHAITMCESSVYVLGGFSGKERLNTVEKYN